MRPRIQWVVLWDPPINKGTSGRIFDVHEEAYAFFLEQQNAGWNIKPQLIQIPNYLWWDYEGPEGPQLEVPTELETINPGVSQLVGYLNSIGFETTDSGDGITNKEGLGDEALDYPHVVMQVSPDALISESMRLLDILKTYHGIEVKESGDPNVPSIECSFDPANGIGLIVLSGVNDAKMGF